MKRKILVSLALASAIVGAFSAGQFYADRRCENRLFCLGMIAEKAVLMERREAAHTRHDGQALVTAHNEIKAIESRLSTACCGD